MNTKYRYSMNGAVYCYNQDELCKKIARMVALAGETISDERLKSISYALISLRCKDVVGEPFQKGCDRIIIVG